MQRPYIEEQTYEGINFAEKTLPIAEYEYCQFINCHLADTDLSHCHFATCTFTGCNLSNAKLHQTALKDVKFRDCKMLGLRFDMCHDFLFGVSFDTCLLNLSSFYQKKMKKTSFKHCSLQEIDFTETDLSQAIFEHCDLANTVFEQSNLEKADFRTASNYRIDPQLNKIKKAKFSLPAVVGLLDGFGIEVSLG